MTSKLTKIKKIAKQVRMAFEKIEDEEGYFQNNLEGYCARASLQLYFACRDAGIEIELKANPEHAFNVYDEYIIDITATQFLKHANKVYVSKIKNNKNKFHMMCEDLKYIKSAPSVVMTMLNVKKEEFKKDKKMVKKYLKGRNG